MIKKKHLSWLVNHCLILVAACAVLVVNAETAKADAITNCVTEAYVAHEGSLPNVPADSYDIYAKLAKRGQSAIADVGMQSGTSGACATVGDSVEISGDKWTHVGTWAVAGGLDAVYFQLASDQLSPDVDANRPSILMVSATKPVCTVQAACTMLVDGRLATVLPPGNSVEQETLRVVRPIAPELDRVQRVIYYVDNIPVYSTPTLQPFDERYAVHYSQEVVSVVEYASGQRVAIEERLPEDYTATLGTVFFQIFNTNARLYTGIMLGAIVFVLCVVVILVVRAIDRRQSWVEAHGFVRHEYHEVSPIQRMVWKYVTVIYRWTKRTLVALMVVFSAFVAIMITISYGGVILKVSGGSMEPTYHDGSVLIVNKLPVTLSGTSGRDYIPKRGEVVVMRAVFGVSEPEVRLGSSPGYMVKRVLGLPGERVVVRDGVVVVHQPDGNIVYPDDNIQWVDESASMGDVEVIDITLQNDELFVAGDNRQSSLDSRLNGAVMTNQVVGVVVTPAW